MFDTFDFKLHISLTYFVFDNLLPTKYFFFLFSSDGKNKKNLLFYIDCYVQFNFRKKPFKRRI